MSGTGHFRSPVAVALAITALIGASAFADSRHPKTTGSRNRVHGIVQEDRLDDSRGRIHSGNPQTPRPEAADRLDRVRGTVPKAEMNGRDRDGRTRDRDRMVIPHGVRAETPSTPRPVIVNRSDRNRAGAAPNTPKVGRDAFDANRPRNTNRNRGEVDRSRNRWDGGSYRGSSTPYQGSYGNRTPYYATGRISRVRPYGDGYRVWIVGAPYPYFIPSSYYHHGHFNVGLTIRIGGYYNPLGYYDYYGDYWCNELSEQRLRGIVEHVDIRRDTFVLRLTRGRGFVTVINRDHFERVWPGDYVAVYGYRNRWGEFVANYVDVIRECCW